LQLFASNNGFLVFLLAQQGPQLAFTLINAFLALLQVAAVESL
jgi:hypothetical protein